MIGAAFTKIVNSLMSDVLMPPLGLLMGRVNFSSLFFSLNPSVRAVVVGIGINVATDPAHLPEGSTSVIGEGATHVSRDDLIRGVCDRFIMRYNIWNTRGFAPIREALRPLMALFGQPVHIAAGSQRFEGTAQDLDEHGRLVVRLDSGVLRSFDDGEVTLRR